MQATALTSQDLSIGYQRRNSATIIAEAINISLQQGKLTCLMGANGIGKSTLIKTLTGVLPPLSGSVLLGEKEICDHSQIDMAKSISVLLTERPSSGFMTVKDLISLGRFPYTNWRNNFNDTDTLIVEDAIKNVGLSKHRDAPISELSDGNLQKAIIGRALAQDTDIIILDEPTIHLDVNNKTVIIKLLQNLCHEHKKTILMSTHDLELTMAYADRLWLFSEDNLIEGLPEDIYLDGRLNKVFYETNKDQDKTDFFGDSIQIEGEATLVELLKQAIVKSMPSAKFNTKQRIKVSRADKQLLILFKEEAFSTIEDFLKVFTSQLK